MGHYCCEGNLCEACQITEHIGLLRECIPFLQRSRFGNPGADELLARVEAALLASEGK